MNFKNNHLFMRNLYTLIFSRKQLVYLFLFLFGCLFLTIDICNHYFFRTSAFDYGVYNFAFFDYAVTIDVGNILTVYNFSRVDFTDGNSSFVVIVTNITYKHLEGFSKMCVRFGNIFQNCIENWGNTGHFV